MSGKAIHSILQRPMITEKSTIQKEDANQVVFKVRRDANKIEIRQAVESLLNVKVTGVNTAIVRGKSKRMGKVSGRRPNWKKAIVTLAPGQEVEFFETLDELGENDGAAEE
jgi:large subunit ribosomal protein L23